MLGLFKRFFSQENMLNEEKNIEEFQKNNMEKEEVEGLNFKTALEAHQNWKIKLKKYLEDTSEEILDYNYVCLDNQCILGKWIYSNGQYKYGDFEIFKNLIEYHKNFHISAGKIIELVNNNNKIEAENILNKEYANYSLLVQKSLLDMYINIR